LHPAEPPRRLTNRKPTISSSIYSCETCPYSNNKTW
jgi:hypothetical protein